MRTILLLGSTGLLGQAFRKLYEGLGHRVIGISRLNSDINLDVADSIALTKILDSLVPDLIINCAAIVDIGYCEKNSERAFAVNTKPVGVICSWAGKRNTQFVQISSDHFFAGRGRRANSETDPVEIKNHYADSKYQAEQIAMSYKNSLVLRTSILGVRGWEAPTFYEWALDVVNNNLAVTLFSDAYTSSIDVYQFVDLANELVLGNNKGLYNLAAREVYSKKEFVIKLADQLGADLDNYKSGSIKSLPVRRSESLGLDVTKVTQTLSKEPPNLEEVITSLLANSQNRLNP